LDLIRTRDIQALDVYPAAKQLIHSGMDVISDGMQLAVRSPSHVSSGEMLWKDACRQQPQFLDSALLNNVVGTWTLLALMRIVHDFMFSLSVQRTLRASFTFTKHTIPFDENERE
jgi:hypothetical protein